MKILVIGDSHSYSGWKDIRIDGVQIEIIHLGPKLMHSFGKEQWDLVSQHTAIDVVVFCFGEIDIRCHLFKQIETIWGIQQEIDRLVLNYIEAVIKNVDQSIGLKTCIYFVPPTVKKETVEEDIQYPFVGSDIQRRIAVRYMNHRLSMSCNEKGFIFIDLYDQYCDKEGYLNKEMSDGSVHIKDTKPLLDFIYGELLNDRSL